VIRVHKDYGQVKAVSPKWECVGILSMWKHLSEESNVINSGCDVPMRLFKYPGVSML